MNVSVNLLHEEELRYQGLVGRKFIVRVAVGTVACLLLIVGSLALYSYLSARKELNTLQGQWRATEPHYKTYLKQQRDLAADRAVVNELDGWHRGRLPMAEVLLEVQRSVAPYAIQFTRLTVAGELTFIQPPPPPKPALDAEPAAGTTNAPPAKPPPATPARRWHITITGRAFGAQGHTEAVNFADQLQRNPQLAEVWEAVRLQNISRAQGAGRRDEQVFTIEGQTKLRKCE